MNSINHPSIGVELRRDPVFMQIRVLWGHCSCHQVLAAFPPHRFPKSTASTLSSQPLPLPVSSVAFPTFRLTPSKLPPQSLEIIFLARKSDGSVPVLKTARVPHCLQNDPQIPQHSIPSPFPIIYPSPSLTSPLHLPHMMLQDPLIFPGPQTDLDLPCLHPECPSQLCQLLLVIQSLSWALPPLGTQITPLQVGWVFLQGPP